MTCFHTINDVVSKYSTLTEFKGFKPKTILNLTFRGGNYSLKLKQWTAEQELELIPLLVKLGQKPVGSIVIKNLRNGINDIVIPTNCKLFLYTNQWKNDIALIFNPNNTNYKMILEKYKNDTTKMLTELCNETMSYRDIGILYGYNDDFN